MLNEKSLRYKIAQTVISFSHKTIGKSKDFVGGTFAGTEVINKSEKGVDCETVIRELQSGVPSPLLIPADLENGCGCAVDGLTELPFLMGLGAANDEKIAYNYGLASAKEARSVGINWALSPIVDLNLNPRNPVVNTRSVSDNPDRAIPILKAVIKGMQDGGIAACAKHFPGDGVDWRDQHHITTYNSLPFSEYMKYHGRVFKEMIDAGVYTIMSGHIAVPDYQKERIDGLAPPATLSYELLTNLLRKEMGFKGVVVSDALSMGGLRGWYPTDEETEIRVFKAGCDMMLWPHDDYVDNMLIAVENGFVSEERINEAYNRVEELKEKLHLNTGKYTVALTDDDKKFIADTQKESYEKSLTLVCDKNSQIPLKNVETIAIIPVGREREKGKFTETAVNELENRGYKVSVHTELTHEKLKVISEENDKILFLLYSEPHIPAGPLDYFDWDASAMWASLCYGKEKTIVVSLGNPYFRNQYFERAYTYINAYSPGVPGVKAVIRAICGEAPITGTSPVNLDILQK